MKSLKCINIKVLEGNEVAPPLEEGKIYKLKTRYICKCGQEHYDVGLKSNYNWISCYKCKGYIPNGSIIHWCHPTRFEFIEGTSPEFQQAVKEQSR